MKEPNATQIDQLLDLLADEVAKRLNTRSAEAEQPPEGSPSQEVRPDSVEASGRAGTEEPAPRDEPLAGGVSTADHEEIPVQEDDSVPTPPGSSHTARLLSRLAIGLLAVLILINIPINRHGKTLATAMPDQRALVIRDGLVVKEEGDTDIYVYRDNQFRWISSLTAFETRGYSWRDVHIVQDGFLDQFEIGPPIHVILKCPNSPHIYLLEGDAKRWIVDIEAFEAKGFVWEDVKVVPCPELRGLPNGETIPPGQGPPPQP